MKEDEGKVFACDNGAPGAWQNDRTIVLALTIMLHRTLRRLKRGKKHTCAQPREEALAQRGGVSKKKAEHRLQELTVL